MPALKARSMTPQRSQRLCEGSLDSPAFTEPVVNPSPVNPDDASPFLRGTRQAVMGDAANIALVSVLVHALKPAAVFRRVGAVVIDAFYRVTTRRPRPHVGKERLERFAPSFAHVDAARAVVLVVVIGWCVAAGLHMAPRPILAAFCEPVRAFVLAERVDVVAAAATRVAGPDAAASYDHLVAAVAFAAPHRLTGLGSSASGNSQSPASATEHIDGNGASHDPNILLRGRA